MYIAFALYRSRPGETGAMAERMEGGMEDMTGIRGVCGQLVVVTSALLSFQQLTAVALRAAPPLDSSTFASLTQAARCKHSWMV